MWYRCVFRESILIFYTRIRRGRYVSVSSRLFGNSINLCRFQMVVFLGPDFFIFLLFFLLLCARTKFHLTCTYKVTAFIHIADNCDDVNISHWPFRDRFFFNDFNVYSSFIVNAFNSVLTNTADYVISRRIYYNNANKRWKSIYCSK